MPFDGLVDRTTRELERLIDAIEGTEPIQTECWEFVVPRFVEGGADPELVGLVDEWANSTYFLYCFELLGQQNPEELSQEFAHAKAQARDGRAYSRLNDPSRILYVGGSASIATRLRQHLGFGARKTYSLHLAHWAAAIGVNLRFCCAGYGDANNTDVFEALEDQLWEERAPMFGRKGRR